MHAYRAIAPGDIQGRHFLRDELKRGFRPASHESPPLATGSRRRPWRAFNELIGSSGDVGIWHETYRIRPGDYESMYVNMTPFGLGKVGQLVEAQGPRETAAGRLAAST